METAEEIVVVAAAVAAAAEIDARTHARTTPPHTRCAVPGAAEQISMLRMGVRRGDPTGNLFLLAKLLFYIVTDCRLYTRVGVLVNFDSISKLEMEFCETRINHTLTSQGHKPKTKIDDDSGRPLTPVCAETFSFRLVSET